MQKVVDEGKLKVRLLAPPVQLTGDPDIDRTATYEAVLVADDSSINSNNTFLDNYEVRISPKPELYSVRLSTSSKSLQEADKVMAEEELARLRLDEASLNAGVVFSTNIQPLLQKRLDDASAAASNSFKSYNGQITDLTSNLLSLTNVIADLNQKIFGITNGNNSFDTNAFLAARSALNTNQIHLESYSRQRDLVTLQLGLTESNLVELNNKVAAARDMGDVTAAYQAAVSSFETFWSGWAGSRSYFSSYSTNSDFHTNYSAVSILFRPQAVAGLKQITIDVIRKSFQEETNTPPQRWEQTRLKQTLDEISDLGSQISGLLLSSDYQFGIDDRWRRLNALNNQLFIKSRQLAADEIAFYVYRNSRRSSSPGQVPTTQAGSAPSEEEIENQTKTNAIEVINDKILNQLTCVSNDVFSVRADLDKIARSDFGKKGLKYMTNLTTLRGDLVYIDDLLESKMQIWSSIGNATNNILIEHYDPLTDRILAGNQAVFHLNVVHGMVTTTAYMLPDDGAAQMFGHAFADHFYAAQVTFFNPNDRPILIYGNTLRLVVRMNAADPSGRLSEDGILERQLWWAMYEPLDYDSLRRMMEGQQAHSWQNRLDQLLDAALMAGGGWVGVGAASSDFSQAFGVISALTPKLKDVINEDLVRNASNFHDKGLNSIEEIPAQGVITRDVFLPKGAIYGTYSFDTGLADELPMPAKEHRWNPFFLTTANDFGKIALQPAYIHDVRREEAYVKGKRILTSDPLTPSGATP
jgi:hypothetical protein